ncbi:MAG: DUF2505 domain-containing protein [Actinomycetota bacterium]|nr:DUF2505 domain-containing protein [Actinomycetota bacterium]
MRFEVTHSFPHDPDEVAAAILDLDYQQSLKDLESLKARELLSQEENPDGSVVRRVRCVLDIEISGVAKSFIGSGDPAWIEEATWDPASRRWRWTVLPEIGKDLLEASGTIELRPAGGGTQRAVSGEVKVKVPIYGGKVEGWIVDGIDHAYAEEAERLHAWLSGAAG